MNLEIVNGAGLSLEDLEKLMDQLKEVIPDLPDQEVIFLD